MEDFRRHVTGLEEELFQTSKAGSVVSFLQMYGVGTHPFGH